MHKEFLRFSGTDDYITSPALEDAVNVALALERPLLLKGEPGTGKTLLATSVAEALQMELIKWNVKSTTTAEAGLYVYDTVQRLHDSRFGDADVSDIRRYIKLGPLGRAFSASQKQVLLIDEIDKADIEFPNDLLNELDNMSFTIYELDEVVAARQRPFVVITSNNEKELPGPFLRRCVFHYIDFPDVSLMRRIVAVHHPELDRKMVDQCIRVFYDLRETAGLRKRPSTSELIDWIAALKHSGVSLRRLKREIPFLGTLIKAEQDLELVG
jgi:MoxR-like ATPase